MKKIAIEEHFTTQGYLKDVLGRIRSHRVDRLAELLPFNWSPVRV